MVEFQDFFDAFPGCKEIFDYDYEANLIKPQKSFNEQSEFNHNPDNTKIIRDNTGEIIQIIYDWKYYNQEKIDYGKFEELTQYSKAQTYGFKELFKKKMRPKEEVIRTSKNDWRVRKTLRNLILTNFSRGSLFITYTFNRVITFQQAKTYWRNYVKRRMPCFLQDYLWIMELGSYQRRRFEQDLSYRPHIHSVSFGARLSWHSSEDRRLIENWISKEFWKAGFVDVRPVDSTPEKIANYLSKYMTKNKSGNFLKSSWGYSRSLKKSPALKTEEIDKIDISKRIYNFQAKGISTGKYRKILSYK
jgi:hypothetical protein